MKDAKGLQKVIIPTDKGHKHQSSTRAFPEGRKVMVVCIQTSISDIDVYET